MIFQRLKHLIMWRGIPENLHKLPQSCKDFLSMQVICQVTDKFSPDKKKVWLAI